MIDNEAPHTEPTINSRIAKRVQSLRTEQGLTLDELAAKCDVSRSMISLIERGESNPTAVLLEKIATGLAIPLATLFDMPTTSVDPLSLAADRTTWQDPQTGYTRRNISPATYPSPIQIVEVELPAGAVVAYETGARDVDIHQQVWIQKGSVEMTVGYETYRLAKDDCLAMQLNAPITYRNNTDKPVHYLVILSTERFQRTKR